MAEMHRICGPLSPDLGNSSVGSQYGLRTPSKWRCFFMKKTNLSVKDLVTMAFYLALFMIFDAFVNTLPFFQMPQGGSLGISTVVLLIASYHLGFKKGLIVSVLSVLLQFVTGRMYILGFTQFCLDYLIAFGAYGFACLFPNYKEFYSGVLITNCIRFISSTISGVVFYNTTLAASIIYQAWYMVPTTIVGLIFVPLLYKALSPRIKEKAVA